MNFSSEKWMQDDLADTEKEEFECAIALSLSEMDQKGKKVIGNFQITSQFTFNH